MQCRVGFPQRLLPCPAQLEERSMDAALRMVYYPVMKKRDIYIYIGVFLLVVGILPLFGVNYGKLTIVTQVLTAICGLIVLINR